MTQPASALADPASRQLRRRYPIELGVDTVIGIDRHYVEDLYYFLLLELALSLCWAPGCPDVSL